MTGDIVTDIPTRVNATRAPPPTPSFYTPCHAVTCWDAMLKRQYPLTPTHQLTDRLTDWLTGWLPPLTLAPHWGCLFSWKLLLDCPTIHPLIEASPRRPFCDWNKVGGQRLLSYYRSVWGDLGDLFLYQYGVGLWGVTLGGVRTVTTHNTSVNNTLLFLTDVRFDKYIIYMCGRSKFFHTFYLEYITQKYHTSHSVVPIFIFVFTIIW